MNFLTWPIRVSFVLVYVLNLASFAGANVDPTTAPVAEAPTPSNRGIGVTAPEAVPVESIDVQFHFLNFNVMGGDTLSAGINGVNGKLSSTEVGTQMSFFVPINRKLILNFGVGDGESYYHFSGPSGLVRGGGSEAPWSHVRTLTANGRIIYRYDDHWTFFAGVNGSSAGADGSRFDDTLTGGGAAGATYKFSDDLTLGLGLTGQSRLESSPTILPFPIVDWVLPFDPQKRWRLEGGPARSGPGREAGAAIVFSPDKTLSLSAGLALTGLGGGFRLDQNGPIPGGVGRVTSLPFVFGIDWRPHPGLQVNGFAGISTSGTIEALDRNGNSINQRDVNAAATFGVNASLSF